MGILLNHQHETFSQEVAKGTTVAQAYRIAGYPFNKGNAYRLRLRKRVAARIAELTAARTEMVQREALTAAEKAGLDHFWVLRSLRRNAVLAARKGDTAASNRAVELIGKHLNMFIDRKELTINMVDDADEYLRRIMEQLQAPVIEHEPVAKGGTNDGSAPGVESQVTDIT